MRRESRKRVPDYCSRKNAYDKKGAISEANRWWRKERKRLVIYPCRDHWHISHKMNNENDWKRFR